MHDSTIRVWSTDGEYVTELCGHASFIYSICQVSPGVLASSAEDRYIYIYIYICSHTPTYICLHVY